MPFSALHSGCGRPVAQGNADQQQRLKESDVFLPEKRKKSLRTPRTGSREGATVSCVPLRGELEGRGGPEPEQPQCGLWAHPHRPPPLPGRRFQLPGEGSGQTGEQVGRCPCGCFLTCSPVILRPLGARDSVRGTCWPATSPTGAPADLREFRNKSLSPPQADQRGGRFWREVCPK